MLTITVILFCLLFHAAFASFNSSNGIEWSFREHVLIEGVKDNATNVTCDTNCSLPGSTKTVQVYHNDNNNVKYYVPIDEVDTTSYESGASCWYETADGTSIQSCKDIAQLEKIRRAASNLTWDSAIGLMSDALLSARWHYTPQNGRYLAVGDFDSLNALLRDVVFKIPNQNIDAGSGLTVGIKNLRCGSINIGDIRVTSRKINNKKVEVAFAISRLAVSCSLDYTWDWWIFGGGGRASGGGRRNALSTTLRFESVNFDTTPPHQSNTGGCSSQVYIDDLNLSGGITSSILSLFKGTVKGYVSNELNKVVCKELGTLGSTTLTDLLNEVKAEFDPYLGPPVNPDALAMEKAMVIPPGVNLVSWKTSEIMNLLNMGIEDGLGKEVNFTNADGSVEKSLGVNFAVKALLGGTGSFNVTFNETEGILYSGHDPLTETTIKMDMVKVTGLDSFENFDPMNAIGNYTLHHHLKIKKLTAKVHLSMIMKPSTLSNTVIHTGSGQVKEEIVITTALDDVEIDTSTLIAIDEDKLMDLQIGSLMETPLECALSTLFMSNITQMKLTLSDIDQPYLTGFIDHGLDRFFTGMSDAIFLMYEKIALKALPNMMETLVRDMANKGLGEFLESKKSGCYEVIVGSEPKYFNFHTDPLFQQVRTMINDFLVVNVSTHPEKNGINSALIGPLTQGQSGTAGVIDFQGTLFRANYTEKKHSTFGLVDLHVRDVRLEGIDTVYNMSLLNTLATEPHSLSNTIGFAYPDPFKASLDVLIRIEEGPIEMYNDFRIYLDIYKLFMHFKNLLLVNVYKFDSIRLGQVTTFECWLATIPKDGFIIQQMILLFQRFGVHLFCDRCTSTGFLEVEKRLQWNTTRDQMTSGVNYLVNEIAKVAQSPEAHEMINDILVAAPQACLDKTTIQPPKKPSNSTGGGSSRNKKDTKFYILIGAIVLMAGIGLGILGWLLKQYLAQRRMLKYQKQIDENRQKEKHVSPLINCTKSLFSSADSIPCVWRYTIPVILVINIAFFVSGHLSLGATVDIHVQLAGENITIPSFFTFSMAQSTIDMWKAGAYPLAVIIIIFSGLWPYIKMFTMIFLWFAPPTWVAPASRGTIFLWLDVLGKWSMIDIFVLVMSMIAFRLQIVSPETWLALPPNFYVIDLIVVPVWGLYANIIAQLLSQLVSHVVIYYHRNVIAAAEEATGERLANTSYALKSLRYEEQHMQSIAEDKEVEMARMRATSKKPRTSIFQRLRLRNSVGSRSDSGGRARRSTWLQAGTNDVSGPRRALVHHREALYAHIYNIDGIIHRIQIRPFGTFLLLLGLSSAVFLIYYGAGLKSFRMDVEGLAGIAIDLGVANSSIQEYSVFDVSGNIAKQADPTSFWSVLGINYIALIFLICALIVPICQMSALFIMWIAPLTLYELKVAFMINEIFAAWQYLEVYLIAISVAVLQMGQVSGFMVGKDCDGVIPILNKLVKLNVINSSDGTCFYVNASVLFGTWILLFAAVNLNICTQLITRAAETAMEDREARIKGALLLNQDRHQTIFFRKLLLLLKLLCCARFIEPGEDENSVNGLGIKEQKQFDMHWNSRKRTLSDAQTRNRKKSKEKLPEYWKELETPDGEVYYWNTLTGKTQWDVPVTNSSWRKKKGQPLV